jgi:hypothetical protein
MGGFGGEIEDEVSYFSFTNFVTPREIYKINLTDMSQELFWKEDLKGHDQLYLHLTLNSFHPKMEHKYPSILVTKSP